MNICMDGEATCQKHGKKIKQIVLDHNCLPENRLICSKCIETARQPFKQVIGVGQAKEMIKERILQQYAQFEEQIEPKMKIIRRLQQNLIAFRFNLIKNMDEILEWIQKYITELKIAIKSNEQIDLIEGLQFILTDQKVQNLNLEFTQNAYLIKLDSSFQRLLKEIKVCHEEFMSLYSVTEKQIQTMSQEKQVELYDNEKIKNEITIAYKEVNQMKQKQNCQAIAFNKTGDIMIAGFDKNIKVWKFDNDKINELTELEGDGGSIICLIFSKKNEWFVSGDEIFNILLWKQGKSIKDWQKIKIKSKHKNSITCMIFNQQEDQLITCGLDQIIIIWQFDDNKISYDYSYVLEKKHTDDISCLSLNSSESSLVSSGHDQQIILWGKVIDDKWEFLNSIKMDTYIPRICFINENQLVIQQWGEGFSNVFIIEEQQLKEQKDLLIKFTDQSGSDWPQFPTIYNKMKDIIIQKSFKYVYIISRDIEGYYKVLQPINCETYENFGTLSEDGTKLVIWNNFTNEFRIYILTYK